jgi:hypothetical protein
VVELVMNLRYRRLFGHPEKDVVSGSCLPDQIGTHLDSSMVHHKLAGPGR